MGFTFSNSNHVKISIFVNKFLKKIIDLDGKKIIKKKIVINGTWGLNVRGYFFMVNFQFHIHPIMIPS